MQNDNTVGEFLREIRRKKKETQADIASRMRVTKFQVSHLETGRRAVQPVNVEKVIKGYQLTEGQGECLRDMAGLKSDFIKSGKAEVEILYLLTRLPKEVRRRIIDVAIAYDSLQEKQ